MNNYLIISLFSGWYRTPRSAFSVNEENVNVWNSTPLKEPSAGRIMPLGWCAYDQIIPAAEGSPGGSVRQTLTLILLLTSKARGVLHRLATLFQRGASCA
jgi:hypothetical protein